MIFFKSIGVVGLVLIMIGVVQKKNMRIRRDILFIIGGICLGVYSIYIHDLIFIILQIAFTITAVYDIMKFGYKKKRKSK